MIRGASTAECLEYGAPDLAEVIPIEAFNRRKGARNNRGRIRVGGSAVVIPSTPLSILGGDLLNWIDAEFKTLNVGNVSALLDQGPNVWDFTQATATNQPLWEATGYSGMPSVLYDGVDNFMFGPAALATALVGGDDNPHSIFTSIEFTAINSLEIIFCCANGASNNRLYDAFANNTGPVWQINKDGDGAGGLSSASGGTPLASTRYLLEIHHTGTAVTLVANGSTIINAVAQDVLTVTVDNFSIACTMLLGAAANFANLRMANWVACNVNLLTDAPRLAAMRAYQSARYP